MTDYFEQLHEIKDNIAKYKPNQAFVRFYQQEVQRFISIAGTLQINGFSQNNQNTDSRYFSHILTRSLLENFFTLIYIFDCINKSEEKLNEVLNGFKRNYLKLYNEPELPHKEKLPTANQEWSTLAKPKDIKSMLDTLKNENGDRLGYLYFVYRITSFDVHGKNLNIFLEQSFDRNINFPILDIAKVFNLIANEYLLIWRDLENEEST